MNDFVHLFCASWYSLQRGVFSPARLVEAAARRGDRAVGLTDLRGLYGAVPFCRAACDAGIRPVPGAWFPAPEPGAALVALARDNAGYGNLCRLITEHQVARPKPGAASGEQARAPEPDLAEMLARLGDGLICLCSDPSLLRRLRDVLPAEALFGELFRPDDTLYRRLARRVAREAESLGLRSAATNRVHFLVPEDHAVHRVLTAIRTLRTVDTLLPNQCVPDTCYFTDANEMARVFADAPDALRATVDIAEMCEVSLPLGGMRAPGFLSPGETPEAFLRRLCEEALPRFYAPSDRPAAAARLRHELEVICSMGYAAYFLVVWDIARFARQKAIPSTGRGSAADSIVSYLLGLTHVDPVKHNLYFERFLNPERTSAPDIDLDLCWRRRDDVIDYVYERWGADRVAMISTHVTFAGRACVREVGKALGISEDEITRYTRFLPHYGPVDYERLQESRPESRNLDFTEEPLRSIIPFARRVEGMPHHLGVHPSGIVVAPEPLQDWIPLEPATKGLMVTQYDMYPVEDLGFLKIDLLGQRSLSVIADVCEQIRDESNPAFDFQRPGEGASDGMERHGSAAPPPVDPESDAPTCDLIAEGRTMGVFQVESPSMRGILKKVRARDFGTVTAASSVIRPGPKDSGMLKAWIRRHRGLEPPKFAHARLREILAETHGIMIYQEDVLKVAQAIAGMTLGRADQMRRSMSAKRPEDRLITMEEEFKAGARRNGVDPASADEIWKQMRAFAGYAFCKAHSASYTVLSFRSAYLKTHFPAEFMAAVLANGGGYYDRAAYVSEARRLGLRILGPSLEFSEKRWTGRSDHVRCGLEQIRHLREKAVDAILRERKRGGAFGGFPAALERLPELERSEWDGLVLSGACDDLLDGAAAPGPAAQRASGPATRPQLLWLLDQWFAPGRGAAMGQCGVQLDLLEAPGSGGVMDAKTPPGASPLEALAARVPDLPEFPFERLYDDEYEALDLAVRCHPLERFRPILPDPRREGFLAAKNLPRQAGRRVKLVGWLVTSRRLRTSRGGYMKFLTLEDKTDIYEAILFDRAYRAYGHLTVSRGPYLLEGRVEEEEGHCSVHVGRLSLLRAPAG